jgi:hypothetical protein
LQVLRETGATGLEPATSGVTGLFHGNDDWRRWVCNRSIDAGLRRSSTSFVHFTSGRLSAFAALLLPRNSSIAPRGCWVEWGRSCLQGASRRPSPASTRKTRTRRAPRDSGQQLRRGVTPELVRVRSRPLSKTPLPLVLQLLAGSRRAANDPRECSLLSDARKIKRSYARYACSRKSSADAGSNSGRALRCARRSRAPASEQARRLIDSASIRSPRSPSTPPDVHQSGDGAVRSPRPRSRAWAGARATCRRRG